MTMYSKSIVADLKRELKQLPKHAGFQARFGDNASITECLGKDFNIFMRRS